MTASGQHVFNNSRWWIAMAFWLLTLGTFIFYLNYVEPLKDLLGGQNYLDLRFSGYEYTDVQTFYQTLGEAGRALYIKTTVLDTVWPIMVAISVLLLAPLCLRRRWLVVLATVFSLGFAGFDLLENIGLLTMTTRYPDITGAMVSYTLSMTQAKALMIPGAALAFLGLPIVAICKKLA